jgi:hypothetical protein
LLEAGQQNQDDVYNQYLEEGLCFGLFNLKNLLIDLIDNNFLETLIQELYIGERTEFFIGFEKEIDAILSYIKDGKVDDGFKLIRNNLLISSVQIHSIS